MPCKTPVDVMMEARQRPVLTEIERIATECIRQIAIEGREVTQPELCAATGVMYQSGTIPAVLTRLVNKGYLVRKYYQRSQHLGLVLGDGSVLWTAPPKDTTPHWRNRTEDVPAPTIQAVRERAPKVAEMINKAAQIEGMDVQSMLHHLVYIGAHAYWQESGG